MFLALRRRVQFQALRGKVDPILRTRLRMAYQQVKWVPVECQHQPDDHEAIKTLYHTAKEGGGWFEGHMLVLERTPGTNKYLLWGTRKGRWGYTGQLIENFMWDSLSSKNMVKLAYGPINEIRAHLERGEMWLFEEHAPVLYKKMLPFLPGTKALPLKRPVLKKRHPIIKKIKAARLVGIELNPGPIDDFCVIMVLVSDSGYVERKVYSNYYSGCAAAALSMIQELNKVKYDIPVEVLELESKVLQYERLHWYIERASKIHEDVRAYSVWQIERPPAARLVGIELNPGPVSFILSINSHQFHITGSDDATLYCLIKYEYNKFIKSLCPSFKLKQLKKGVYYTNNDRTDVYVNWTDKIATLQGKTIYVPPAPRLVGIEPNPGPRLRLKQGPLSCSDCNQIVIRLHEGRCSYCYVDEVNAQGMIKMFYLFLVVGVMYVFLNWIILVGIELNPGPTLGIGTCFYCQIYSEKLERDQTNTMLVDALYVWSCRKCNTKKGTFSITQFMNVKCNTQGLVYLEDSIEAHDKTVVIVKNPKTMSYYNKMLVLDPPAPPLVGIEPNPGPIALIKLGQNIYRLHITSDPFIKIECWDKETWSNKGSSYSVSNLNAFLNQFSWTPQTTAEFNALYHHMRATY